MAADTPSLLGEPVDRAVPEATGSLLGVAWRYKWLILLLTLVGLGLGYLDFLRRPPVYQSRAEILVTKRRPVFPGESHNPQDYKPIYDDTLEVVLRSPSIVEEAIRIGELNSRPSLRENALAKITMGLTIAGAAGNDGDVVVLSYESEDRSDCKPVLDALIAAYEDHVKKTYEDVSAETRRLINDAHDSLLKEIDDLEEQIQQHLMNSPLLVTKEGTTNVHEARLTAIEQSRAALVLRISQIKAKIQGFQEAIERGSSRDALRMLAASMSSTSPQDPKVVANNPIDRELFPLLLEEQSLLEKYGADHPLVVSIRRRIELTRKLLTEDQEKARGGADVAERDIIAVYLEALHEEQNIAEQELARYNELFEQEQLEARKLIADHEKYASLRANLGRKERLFDAIVRRLEEIDLLNGATGVKVQKITPPGPGFQIKPVLAQSLALGGIGGFLLALGLTYLLNSADKRFRSPEDVHSELGVPVVGHVPVLDIDPERAPRLPDHPDVSPHIMTQYMPRGRAAEAYRAVRTALYFSARGTNNRLIQITSPSPGDGKSTLAANLAAAIAESGKRVLLVDGDFRRPRVHKYYKVDDSIGLASVIEGEAELSDAIRSTSIKNLDVLPCGPRPKNPSELLTSERFAALLDMLRQKYDIVILDSPPVLAVTDPVAIAPRVDGIFVVMRLTKSARSNIRRAMETLDAVGARVIGVVVNGIGSAGAAGQYAGRVGRYGYRDYGYSYADAAEYGYTFDEYYGDADTNERSSTQLAATAHRNNGRR